MIHVDLQLTNQIEGISMEQAFSNKPGFECNKSTDDIMFMLLWRHSSNGIFVLLIVKITLDLTFLFKIFKKSCDAKD